ncbi:hypothetical protein EV421DRAFT_1740162 [Armillaria borealis]|uniref:Uncharacterized protein n=1 Tax=Armillaria borealis TaxID=47425 RepID=A0AA39J662_9AGAR|nr:hypothetical protein EV421DRAFT_1740162 [Armillaria borealis]
MFMATPLQTRDLMNQIITNGVEHWKVTDELKKTLINYSKALICSSTITSYAGDCKKYILVYFLTALRMNHVKDLPSSDDLISMRALVLEISQQLSVACNWIKKKVHRIPHSVGYYWDLFFSSNSRVLYCWHIIHGNHKAQDFWPNVDAGLEKLRAEGDLKFVIQFTDGRHSALDICYKDNIKKYGDPAMSGFSFRELDSSTDNWVRTINDLVPHIKLNSHGVKHTHDQDDDDNEEEESINGDGED